MEVKNDRTLYPASTLTVSHFLLSTLTPQIKLVQGVDCGEYLHSAHGVEHMWVVTGSSTEAAIVMLAGEDKIDCLLAGECLGTTEQMQCRETPIDAIQTEVLCQPIVEFVSSLSVNKRQKSKQGRRTN